MLDSLLLESYGPELETRLCQPIIPWLSRGTFVKEQVPSLSLSPLILLALFLSGSIADRRLRDIESLFPELADQTPLLAASTPKVTPAYPYQIIDQAKPTFFLTKLFGHLSFVSSYFPDLHLDIDIQNDGYRFLDYRLTPDLIAYKGKERLFHKGMLKDNHTKLSLAQTGIEGIDVYPTSYLNALDGKMPDPDCQLAMIMGNGQIAQLDFFKPIQKEEAGILLLLLLSFRLNGER